MEKLELFSKFYQHQFSFESFSEEGGGAEERIAVQLSVGLTLVFQVPLLQDASCPQGTQFAPVSEGAGEPCSCSAT